MPTIDELSNALVKADAAGDTAGATVLANHIRELQAQPSQGAPVEKGWGETLTSAATSLPSSTFNLVKGIVSAVANPSETAGHIMDLAAGELSAIMPQSVNDFVDRFEVNPQSAATARATANAFNDSYKQGYGSIEGFKDKLANDPASVLGDASTLLTGGASTVGKAGKLGQLLQQSGNALNPLSAIPAVAKGAGKVADIAGSGMAHLLGSPLLTGVGGQTVKTAFNSGKLGRPDFWKHLAGEASMDDVLATAKQNIQSMADQKSAAYKEGMVDITGDKSVLSFDGIDNAMKGATDNVTFKGQIKNEKAYGELQKAQQTIDEWKAQNPAEFHTPEGLDALKQKLWDQWDSIPYNERAARKSVSSLANATKNEISAQAPTYAKVMGGYSDASKEISEIERALSIGDRASADSGIRKLQSLTRNNVQTNYGNRTDLARALEDKGGNDLMTALSGQAMNSWNGRGLSSHIGSAGAVAGAFSNPYSLAMLPFQSPKLVGATAYGAGKAAGIPSKLAAALKDRMPESTVDFIQNSGDKAKSLALLLQQLQQGNTQ